MATMSEIETRLARSGLDLSYQDRASVHFRGKEESQCISATQLKLEEAIAPLEYAKYALCFPSGTAAIASIAQTLKDGDHVIVFDSVYHGTRSYIRVLEELGKLEASFVDLRNTDVLKKHLKSNTKMVYIETPCNPTMKIVPIKAIADILKDREDVFLAVDNTFMSPYFQNPLLYGADIVIHSLTKYMGGHADCLMGAVATNDESLFFRLKETRDVIGAFPSPLECYLVTRSLKTLHVRMQRHMENALNIARFLEEHPKVERVFHPGLPSHPQHQLAMKQCKGFSGMVSFCVKGGQTGARTLVQNLKVFTLAVSLGSLESLIEIPSLMTASALTKDKRHELEIADNLLRMSVGLENLEDLISDLDQALLKVNVL